MRLGVVLSTGGLRGAAHLGVLRRLTAARLPIDIIVGSSVGAVIGAYYAAVGLTIDQLIDDAPRIHAGHLFFHSLRYHTPSWAQSWLTARTGIVPARLEALDHARFDRLHHGVSALGIVCHDLETKRPLYVSTADTHGLPLAGIVRASAAIRPLYPAWSGEADGRPVRLVDGGYSETLPIKFAWDIGATHLIVSDCRRGHRASGGNGGSARLRLRLLRGRPGGNGAEGTEGTESVADRTIYVRPSIRGFGIVPSVSFTLQEAVAAGEAAVTDAVIERARQWTRQLN